MQLRAPNPSDETGVNRRSYLPAGLCLLLLGVAAPVQAQNLTFNGQIRPRWEGRDPAGPGLGAFTSMRTRLGLTGVLERNVRIYVEFQDVRLFGEETHPLFDFGADNLDLHEGFAEIGSFSEGLGIRVGRQEINLGGQRLIGALDWAQQGQSFDGVRLRSVGDWGSVDLFGFTINDAGSPAVAEDEALFGGNAAFATGTLGTLAVYGIHRAVRADDELDTDQTTVGARWAGRSGLWSYRAEGSYQFGERGGDDVSAFMFGARLGAQVGSRSSLTLWYDYLSGDEIPLDGEQGVFETLFATNHKFYGFADLFLNIPVHTAGLGLRDLAIKAALDASDDIRLSLDLHSFRLAEQGSISSTHLGEEIDLTGRYRFTQQVTFVGGASFVAQDEAWAEIGRLSEDMWWGYLMMNVVF